MFPTFKGTADKLALTFDTVKTNNMSDFGDPMREMRPEEQALMQKYVEEGYDQFLTRVSEGREMTKAQVDSIGQGRVWLGQDALRLGLVDKLGTLDTAIRELPDSPTWTTTRWLIWWRRRTSGRPSSVPA